MKLYKIAILTLMVLVGCSEKDEHKVREVNWRKLGLDGSVVNEIQRSGSTLYVATTAGLFKRDIMEESGDFLPVAFSDQNVEALEVVGDGVIVVSLFDKSGVEPPGLFKTIDHGETWAALPSNFGGGSPEPVFDLEVHPAHQNILYATGFSVVAKSVDQGESWQPIYGSWGGFATGMSVVEINPNNPSEIWAGGQGAIENGFLIRSENESDWDTWSDLVENPTVVKEITFTPGDAQRLFVGFEGALLKTSDGGETWQTLIDSEENRFFFGIGLGADNDRVYAGGWLKRPEPQPLTLMLSADGGTRWEEHTFPGESYGGILELQVRSDEVYDVIYLGLDKGGVYEVSVRK